MRAACSLLIGVLLAGCPRKTSPTPPISTAPPATALPVGPPFVAPGERMTYRVSLHAVTLASFVIEVGDLTTLDGREAIIVQAGASTAGLAAMVKQVSANFATWLDPRTGASLRFRVTESAGAGDETIEQSEARFTDAAGGVFPVSTTLPDGTATVEKQVYKQTPIDILTFLVSCRAWDGKPGERRSLEVVRSRYMWRTAATLAERTTLVTALGELPAVRFTAVTSRLNRDGSDDTSIEPREFELWVSDDADRVPLAMVAESDYGNIRLDIVEYAGGKSPNLATP